MWIGVLVDQCPGERRGANPPIHSSTHPPLFLPARLSDARDHSLERQLAETDSAESEATQERPRPAATSAAVVDAHLELRLPLALLDHGFTGHSSLFVKVHFSTDRGSSTTNPLIHQLTRLLSL